MLVALPTDQSFQLLTDESKAKLTAFLAWLEPRAWYVREHWDMWHWIDDLNRSKEKGLTTAVLAEPLEHIRECGTAACLGGWMQIYTHLEFGVPYPDATNSHYAGGYIAHTMQEFFDLPNKALFFVATWPRSYYDNGHATLDEAITLVRAIINDQVGWNHDQVPEDVYYCSPEGEMASY